MNVSLTPELEAFIQERVKSGLYTSASEVVRDALRMLREEDERLEDRRAKIDAKIKRGLAQLERGEGVSGDQVEAHFRARSEAHRRRRA